MKCEHCNKNEATTHIKKNINGEVTEMHLCSECAKELGVIDEFSPESFFKDTFFGNFLGAGIPSMNVLSGIDHCEYCGSTFNDIVKSGKVGCANCYTKFYDKLEPSITKMHGNSRHVGKFVTYEDEQIEEGAETVEDVKKDEPPLSRLDQLKQDLKKAVEEERYEDAAVIRDNIKNLSEGAE